MCSIIISGVDVLVDFLSWEMTLCDVDGLGAAVLMVDNVGIDVRHGS